MNDKYITVAEFSKRANISKQRVYQLLNKRLKEFVQEVDGKKMLDIRALESFSIQGACSNNQDTCSSVVKEVEPDAKQEASALDLLKTTIDMLQKQLEEKDRTIHELTEALKNEQLQTSQAQALHGGSIKQLLEQGQDAEEPEQQKKEAEASKGFFRRLFKR